MRLLGTQKKRSFVAKWSSWWLVLSKLTRKSSDQGAERNRRAVLTAIMNVLSQIVQLMTGIISVPLALDYVGPERFGIWMTLSTALTFITFSDLGIGIGVQDQLSKYIARGDYISARRSFFSSLVFVVFVFFCVMAVSVFVITSFDLAGFFSLKSVEAIDEIVPTTLTVVFCVAIGLPSGIIQRTYNALQDGFVVAVIQAISRFLSLFLLYLVVKLEMGLPALVFVVGGVPNLVLLGFGALILLKRNKWIRPVFALKDEFFNIELLSHIIRVGTLGLGAAIAIYFVNNSPPVVMANKYGAEGVADFAVLLKLISIPGLLLTYVLLPLWPAIAEAKAKMDSKWIKNTYLKCVRMTIIISLLSFGAIILFGREIIEHWTNDNRVVPSFELVLASSIFMLIGYWNTLVSVVLNGLSRFKGQATYGMAIAIAFAVISVCVPQSWPKESIVWVIGLGFFIRCIFMQIEVNRCLR